MYAMYLKENKMSLIIFEKLDAESLKRMVTEFHMKDTEISELSGVSVPAIEKRRQLLNLAGGSTLGKKVEGLSVFIQNKKLPRFDKNLITYDKLYEMYETNLMTDIAIADIYNTKEYIISALRRKYGIITRTVTDCKRREVIKNGIKFFGDLPKEEMISEVLKYGNFVELGKAYCITKTSVRNFLMRKGLNPTELLEYYKDNNLVKFTSIQKEILIGSMLGDGGISQSDLRYYEYHSVAQESYLDWKMKCLGLAMDKKHHDIKKKGEGGQLSDAYGVSFRISCNPYINELRKDFYVFNEDKGHITKTTPALYARDLSNLSLAIWFFDDGFLWHEYPCIFTGAPIKDIEKFVEILNEEKGLDIEITPSLEKEKIIGYRLKITNTNVFWSLVSGYVSDLMIHKFPVKYRSINRGGLLEIGENKMEDTSDFISKVCPEDWKKLLLEEDRCLYLERIASYYESVGFPKAPHLTSDKFQRLMSSLSKIDPSRYIVENRVMKDVPSLGSEIAYAYFPNIFSVETISKDTAYNRYKDSDKFKEVIKNTLEHRKTFSEGGLRNELRRFCSVTNFKPLVAKYLCDRYCPENGVVFDYSAGWSGRLIGCCASSKVSKYIGTDVSKQTFYNLRKVSRSISEIVNKVIEIHNFPSEDIENYKCLEKFDMCVSSPPYFNTEKYSSDPEQSYSRYPEYNLWKEKFLFRVISNCFEKLNTNGCFIINIADVNGYKLVKDAYEKCSELFQYVETIVMQIPVRNGSHKFEPIMVFRKTTGIKNNPDFYSVQRQFINDFKSSIRLNSDYYNSNDADPEDSLFSISKKSSICEINLSKNIQTGNKDPLHSILNNYFSFCRNKGLLASFYCYGNSTEDRIGMMKLKRLFNKNGLLSSFTERLSQVWSSEEESMSLIRTIDNFLAVKKATKHVSSDLSPNN